jgi:hypothetical protein
MVHIVKDAYCKSAATSSGLGRCSVAVAVAGVKTASPIDACQASLSMLNTKR